MIIQDFFENDINRNIETVIKADDRDHISDEVVEYVITNEIAKKIQYLFRDYNDYKNANGVWISGFFGSGKSHLLKILSYVLENREHDGYRCGELFAEKIENDEMLKGDVLAATRIPSESILYNIDQQAQITSKADANAILSVFYKVFFDHLGYYGFQPHVAEFEMWLDRQGKYDAFKTLFAEKYGSPWENARIDYFDPAVTSGMADALGELNGHEASKYDNIFDEIEDRHKQSIEDFCIRVNDYIKSKPAGFRLNFFVDEVGQYISDNSKLMLNMQTLAETLATKTKGHAWVFVTSQEDMEKIVGDMTKTQQLDFSRIQARFKYKIPLTSANVDEVIEKRLLKKKEASQQLLTKIWKQENANLDTLMTFSDVGVQFRKYKDESDFVNKFPFIPYQFDLFQECRRALSTHNAFQGKHASVGERSMLGVFQQVVQAIKNGDEKNLVSYDKMFEGIRNELRGEIQRSVILAERNLDNLLAVNLLKALFLVKYFSKFKTTRRNISVLMIHHMHVDLKEHEKKIDEALNILENQSYVQRNGDVYEYLTDDEKDIEEAIKSTDIDDTAETQMLKEIFFDEIIRDNKIRYADNKQDYDFTSKIDGVMVGREKELGIEIITPNFRDYENDIYHQSQTMGATWMKLVLPLDMFFMRDLKLYLRTNKYIKLNQSTTLRPEVKRILQEKAQLNSDRRKNLLALASRLLSSATVFMNGSKHQMSHTADGRTRVVMAFQDLIKIVYPGLHMLGSTFYSEETIKNTIRGRQDELFRSDEKTMTEAENEVLGFIKRRKSQSERTSLNDIRDYFTRKPYGWYPNAVWTVVAMLYKRDRIECRQDSNLLSDEEMLEALLNSRHHANTLFDPKSEDKPEDIRELRNLYADLFDETITLNTGRDVGGAFKEKLKEMLVDVEKLLMRSQEYPFLGAVEALSKKLESLAKKDYVYYLQQRSDFSPFLLDAKYDLFDPVKKFMAGEQRIIYDSIRKVLEGDTSNLEYLEGEELKVMKNVFNDPEPYKGSKMRDAKVAMDDLKNKLLEQINKEKELALSETEKAINEIRLYNEFSRLSTAQQHEVLEPLKEMLKKIETQRYIANIRDARNRVISTLQPAQHNKMMQLLYLQDGDSAKGYNEPVVHYITSNTIKVNYPKKQLNSHQDVDDYVEALRHAMKEQINKKRCIKL